MPKNKKILLEYTLLDLKPDERLKMVIELIEEMANDPDIQRESDIINREFMPFEMDGLEEKK